METASPWAHLQMAVTFRGSFSVFQRDESSSSWSQMGTPILGDPSEGTYLGQSLSLSGDGTIIAVASDRSVRVYQWVGDTSTWTRMSDSQISGWSQIAISLSRDGTRLVCSGYWSPQNWLRLYQYVSGQWVSSETLGGSGHGLNVLDSNAPHNGYDYPQSVAISADGKTVARGLGPDYRRGKTVVYRENDDGSWSQLGSDSFGSAANYEFNAGAAVALSADGNRLIEAHLVGQMETGMHLPEWVRRTVYRTLTFTNGVQISGCVHVGSSVGIAIGSGRQPAFRWGHDPVGLHIFSRLGSPFPFLMMVQSSRWVHQA